MFSDGVRCNTAKGKRLRRLVKLKSISFGVRIPQCYKNRFAGPSFFFCFVFFKTRTIKIRPLVHNIGNTNGKLIYLYLGELCYWFSQSASSYEKEEGKKKAIHIWYEILFDLIAL